MADNWKSSKRFKPNEFWGYLWMHGVLEEGNRVLQVRHLKEWIWNVEASRRDG